jgi:Tol biopolymer transport system component
MPIRKLLGIAAQVAEGLAKAHTAGIVHRDLKPENVMVSKDGFVKILDFGLAKLVEPESGELSAMPTLARAQTHPGVVMGTVAYMSPEQASGEPVDFRSDQFSFGSMLYEALGGEKPFSRKTAAETMSAIIREDPKSIGALRPDVPLPLRWIVERCLAKDPEERYASTRDLARDLAGVRDHVSEITSGAELAVQVAPTKRSKLPMIAAAAAIVLIAAAGGWIAARARSGKATAPTFRRLTFRTGQLNNARFTPDGQTVVYGATWAGETQGLYAVRPESPESRGFDLHADILAVSPSGEMAVHLNQTAISGTLARVPFAGGVPRPVVESVLYAGADWSPDGKDLVVVRFVEGRSRLEFPVGKVLYEGSVGAPRFSPRGDLIAFQDAAGSIKVIGRSGGDARTLSTGWVPFAGGTPCWTPDGKEIWFSAAAEPGEPEAIHAVDLKGKVRLVAQMPGFLELDDISVDGRALFAHHTIISSLWGLPPGESVERDLTWLDRSVPAELSPDGKTILFSETGEAGGKTASVYLRKTDGSPAVRLGEGEGLALSPDGAWVLASFPADRRRLALVPTGTGQVKAFTLVGFEDIASGAFLPGGTRVIFAARERGKRWRIYALAVGGGTPQPVVPEGISIPPFVTRAVSPDGRWVLAGSGPGTLTRYPLEGGEPRRVAGIERGETAIGWNPAGLVYVFREIRGVVTVSLVDPDSGRRTPWKDLHLPDRTTNIGRVAISEDGRSYVYSAQRVHSQLYVVEGLK